MFVVDSVFGYGVLCRVGYGNGGERKSDGCYLYLTFEGLGYG